MSSFLQPSSPQTPPVDFKKHLIFIALIFLGTFLWINYTSKDKTTEIQPISSSGNETAQSPLVNPIATDSIIATAGSGSVSTVQLVDEKLQNDFLSLWFSPVEGAVTSAVLSKFYQADTRIPVDLFRPFPGFGAFRATFGGDRCLSVIPQHISDTELAFTRVYAGYTLTETLSFAGDYRIAETLQLTNTGKMPLSTGMLTLSTGGLQPELYLSGDKAYGTVHSIAGGSVNGVRVTVNATENDAALAAPFLGQSFNWVITQNKYCASILKSVTPFDLVQPERRMARDPVSGTDYPVIGLNASWKIPTLQPGESLTRTGLMYMGPKELERIEAFDPTLVEVLQLSYFSWFETMARWMIALLFWINGFCQNFAISIIVLTLAIKGIFWPIQTKATVSMRKMQEVQPKMKAIREEFKDNPQVMNAKIMELYRTEGVNPVSGCLPLLLQMPVFIALFAALNGAVELRQESFLWIADLTRPDTVATLFGFGIHPLILVQTGLMILQQRLSPSQAEPMQQKMMMLMPIFILVFFYNMPAGLTLYMTVSSIPQIIQQWYMLKNATPTAAAGSK